MTIETIYIVCKKRRKYKKMCISDRDLVARFEEVLNELSEPGVTGDQARFQRLMKEQSDLQPLVDTYRDYKKAKETIEDSLAMLEEESDEEMREMLKEELSDAKKEVEKLEHELKILLLPKDPNDEKNIMVEIRAGAGGDEAALFAEELYRMYVRYAESMRWKTELVNVNENGIGGFKECVVMVTGQGAVSYTHLDVYKRQALWRAAGR